MNLVVYKDIEKRRAAMRARYAKNPKAQYLSAKKWKETHPAEYKAQRRRQHLKTFGLSPADYRSLLLSQNKVCAICEGINPDWGVLAVDHCHERNFVRGLLCHACNMGLGHMQDDPERLRRAATYLEASAVSDQLGIAHGRF